MNKKQQCRVGDSKQPAGQIPLCACFYKVLLEHKHTPSFICCICPLLCPMTELSSFHTGCMVQKS